jgi:cob(I)alamin adenosyltransferase
MNPHDLVRQIDAQLAHVWMVRTFLKHSDEAQQDDELREVHRELYDYMLALGPSLSADDADTYLKLAQKKFPRLKSAAETFTRIGPEVSQHMNFQMAVRSLAQAVGEIERLLGHTREERRS